MVVKQMVKDFEKNDVSAKEQVQKNHYVESFHNDGKIKVLFIGNSITRHEIKSEIGWDGDWGMAASSRDKDYVHITVKLLEETFEKVDYCIANCGEWELNYFNDEIISNWQKAREFCADLVIVRIGENIWQAKEHFNNSPIALHFDKMVKYFCKNENAKVVLTNLFWNIDVIDDAIERVAKENGYEFVSIGDLGNASENKALGKFWHEGVSVHPNDLGMKRIAERIVEKIKRLKL
ncbi:MAG: SGNH/GDSL hydrolase family protein [Clostridia bacterium]|nr:SGNH/GDSL hydrolase family protein [Clostridia bacterium]